jgi:dihydroneopterin aldolase
MLLSDSYIYINDIRLHAIHGVLPQEQLTGNDYIVNIRIGYDIAIAFASDDVADTLNYAEVILAYSSISRLAMRPATCSMSFEGMSISSFTMLYTSA